ncbi:DUF2249 domain-containing protein [Shimia sp.]|uniref:DUF2249 domain-containing protein n=1 Tax=Shimia sp. TaxID=1954381 RepID=UPI003568DFA5
MTPDEVPGSSWQAPDGLHVDTRGLHPPDPLVAILWHLEQVGQSGPVTAHLDRNPVHLFPELAERGWSYDYAKRTATEVQLVLRKTP